MVRRYGRTQRVAHWWVVATFVLTAATAPEDARGDTTMLVLHICCAAALVLGLVVIAGFGTRRALAADVRALRRLDDTDRTWLRSLRNPRGQRPAMRWGKFNTGQKLAAWTLFAGTIGILLSGVVDAVLGRETVHPALFGFTVVVVIGHVFMAAINPPTRPALRGMVFGSVERVWARSHHPAWLDQVEDTDQAAD
jgi:formate dehydrogenase subunit gamma